MNNPETLATLGRQDTGRRKTKQKTQHRKLKKVSNTDTTKNTTQKTKKDEQHDPPKTQHRKLKKVSNMTHQKLCVLFLLSYVCVPCTSRWHHNSWIKCLP